VLFDQILSYILFEKYIYRYLLALELVSPGNQHRASCIVPFIGDSTNSVNLDPFFHFDGKLQMMLRFCVSIMSEK